jgi:hypothetical protein
MQRSASLSQRRGDWIILIFFAINLLFITYIVDLEQLVIPNPAHFNYPIWPLAFMVDLIHAYGRTFDPVLIARPVWWKATILIDVVGFGPFYMMALYAYTKGKPWIKTPSLVYSGLMMANVIIILCEEFWGPYATPQPLVVLLLNLPWLLMPVYIIFRLGRNEQPFAIQKHVTIPARSSAIAESAVSDA